MAQTVPSQQPSLSEQLLHSTVRIETEDANGYAGSGTGFFFHFLEKDQMAFPAIVTNKHVVTGAARGAFHLTMADTSGMAVLGRHERIEISNFRSVWIEHPDPMIDLCICPMGFLLKALDAGNKTVHYRAIGKQIVSTKEFLSTLMAMEEILMVGYPNGIWDSVNNLPIFRRGITATPVFVDHCGKPEFVIDAACFPGFSGSPIFLFNRGIYATRASLQTGERISLLGVLYAGPQHTAEGEIVVTEIPTGQKPVSISRIPNNLGYCIKAEKILDFEDIIRAGLAKPPDHPIEVRIWS
jgi:hypothetical protein